MHADFKTRDDLRAADGLRSNVREMVFPEYHHRVTRHTMVHEQMARFFQGRRACET
jgi:2-polyprenyl-6-methoxyphenol hydroxylase-like FAD-dependent oxidoreductase